VSSDPGVAHHELDGTSTVLVLEAVTVSGFRHELLVALLALEALHGVLVGIPSVVSDRFSSSVGSVVGVSPNTDDVVASMASGAVSRFSSLEDDALDHVLESLAELVERMDVLFADFTAVVMVFAGVVVALFAVVVSAGVMVLLFAVVVSAGVMVLLFAVVLSAGVLMALFAVVVFFVGMAVVLLLLALGEIVVFQILSESFAFAASSKVSHILLHGNDHSLDFAADLPFDLPKVFTLADVTLDVDSVDSC